MACCRSATTSVKEINLSKLSFPELMFSIKNSTLKFDSLEGTFKQVSNEDPYYRKSVDGNLLANEEEKVTNEIKQKKNKIINMKKKIDEIEDKIRLMNKILLVDVNEREFVTETSKQIKA